MNEKDRLEMEKKESEKNLGERMAMLIPQIEEVLKEDMDGYDEKYCQIIIGKYGDKKDKVEAFRFDPKVAYCIGYEEVRKEAEKKPRPGDMHTPLRTTFGYKAGFIIPK